MLFSCEEKKERYRRYYDIDSLIESQVHYLSSQKISLTKRTRLDEKFDSIQIAASDTVLWSKELEVFKQLNVINTPIYAPSYRVTILPDANSNLTAKVITSTRKLALQYLKIYYQGNILNLRKIEALYREENLLYCSSRKLSMEFENIYNKITLINYSIEGSQKMFLRDSVKFFLKGRVVIN